MSLRYLLQGGLLLICAKAAAADLIITDAYARESPPGTSNSAVFMTLDNPGDQLLTLISAGSDVAQRVELHNHVMVDDMMQMRRVEAIRVEPHQQTQLKPGGLHVMLLGLQRPLKQGESIILTLTFANGEQQQLSVPVKKVMAGMSHSQ